MEAVAVYFKNIFPDLSCSDRKFKNHRKKSPGQGWNKIPNDTSQLAHTVARSENTHKYEMIHQCLWREKIFVDTEMNILNIEVCLHSLVCCVTKENKCVMFSYLCLFRTLRHPL